VRTYLAWLADLPWSTVTSDNLDLHHAKRVLDEDHFDLKPGQGPDSGVPGGDEAAHRSRCTN